MDDDERATRVIDSDQQTIKQVALPVTRCYFPDTDDEKCIVAFNDSRDANPESTVVALPDEMAPAREYRQVPKTVSADETHISRQDKSSHEAQRSKHDQEQVVPFRVYQQHLVRAIVIGYLLGLIVSHALRC